MKIPHRRRIVWILALPAVVFAWYAIYRLPLPLHRATWDRLSETWDDSMHRRHRMADLMIYTGRLIGKERAEIIRLLGAPTDTDYMREYDRVYTLGRERGLIAIDSERLVLRLGGDGTVTEAPIARD
jgi:hypothetical protein